MLHPQGVRGPWKAGIILDWHTVASKVVGTDDFGHTIFETRRSELGELLYQFKYRNDQAALAKLLRLCNDYLVRRAAGKFEIVVPIPPSNAGRIVTRCIAQGIAAGKTVLLVDDVYRSGATLESAAEAVAGRSPTAVYVLALTRTRVHR